MLLIRNVVFLLTILHLFAIHASLAANFMGASFFVKKNVSKVEEATFSAVHPTEDWIKLHISSETVASSKILTTNAPNRLQSCLEESFSSFGTESILNYLLRMRSCDILEKSTKRMDKICAERIHTSNTYYRVVYLLSCQDQVYREICETDGRDYDNPWQRFSKIPRQTEQGSGDENDVLDRRDSQKLPKNIASNFKAENDANLIKQACENVQDFLFFLSKHEVYTNYSNSFSYNLKASKRAGFSFADALKHRNNTIPVVLYSDWYFPYIPFCEVVACGASYEKHIENPKTVYSCAPLSCRTTIGFAVALDALLAFLTIIANALVLGVAARTKIMRNIPGYFKISLALADLTVGFFVLPSCIAVTYTMYIGPLPFRYPGEKKKISDYIAKPLADFVGFFIILSFSASVYTMAAASIDRYLAITKPFQYRQGKYLTKRRSAWGFAVIWLVAIAVAIFPVFTSLPYSISAFNLILSSGIHSSLVYAAALLVPLLTVWCLNGAMLKQVCADREKRSSIRATSVINTPQHYISREIPKPNREAQDYSETFAPSSTTEKEDNTIESLSKTTSRVVVRNASTSSTNYQKNDKRFSVPLGDGIIEKMKRRRSKHSSEMFQKKTVTRQLSLPSAAASVERRLARTLAIMIGAFTIALLPNIATMIAYVALAKDNSLETAMRLADTLYITSRVILSNSFWNCIIYSIRNPHFRRAMWAIFLCKKSKIDQKLRHSLNLSQWKRRSAMASSYGSVNDKRSLSKTSSTASSAQSYNARGHRRSTMLSSLASNSPGESRKGSTDVMGQIKNAAWRTKSHQTPHSPKLEIIKKEVQRSESTPVTRKDVSESWTARIGAPE